MTATDLDFAAYAATHPDADFAAWLRARNWTTWRAMVGHRFTRDIAADRLPEPVFLRYLRYEHAFVRAAITIFGHALVKAPTTEDQTRLVAVLHGLATEQEDYFSRTFQLLNADADMIDEVALPAGAAALRDGLLAIAAQGSFAEILAGMLAAEWMCLTWCTEAHAAGPQVPRAAEWIALHVAAPFAAQVAWLRCRVDQLGPPMPETEQGRLAEVFGHVLQLEIAFHDAPYGAGEG